MTAQLLQLETASDLVDQVYRALLDAISAGALAPGQRITLDAPAVRLAAERRTRIDPALIQRGRAAVAAGDIKTMIDADLAFHCALYQASANPLIEQSALLHWRHIRRAMGEALQHHTLRDPVWDEHAAIARPSPKATPPGPKP